MKKAKRRSAKNPVFGLPQNVAAEFNRLANAQRGKPEDAMTNIQKLHAGVLAFVVEHTGDLTHRMSERYATDSGTFGFSYVKDKVEKVLYTLNHNYGFEKEHKENIIASARYHHIDLTEYNKTLDKLLEDYALAHKKLVVYNETQDFAKRAAVYLGEQKWSRAVIVLEILQNLLQDKDAYLQKASEFTLKNGVLQKFKVLPTETKSNPLAPAQLRLIDDLHKLLKAHPSWTYKDAIAYLHNRANRYTPEWRLLDQMYERAKAVYKSNPLEDEDLAACYYALLRLRSNPDASEDIDDPILDALESEGLWNIDSGVTKEGIEWLESVSSDSHDD